MYLRILALLISVALESHCDTKVWTYSTEIYDPQNWKGGRAQKDCDGLVFAGYNDVPVFIHNLRVKQLVLPKMGIIRFEEGSTIIFDENSQDDMNCVELNPSQVTFFYNASAWSNLDNPDNPAVPYLERPPCRYDDVVIPKGFNSSIIFVVDDIPVKSVTFGNEKLTQNDVNELTNSDVIEDVFAILASQSESNKKLFKITGEDCKDPTGCDRSTFFPALVFKPEMHKELQCTDGIIPGNNLDLPICGAKIVIRTIMSGFTIDKINKKLREYDSYTHASKFDTEGIIQIIFTEKEFTGSSLVEATEFYSVLKGDDSYFCGDVTLITSGPPFNESNIRSRNALSIVFGTLVGVIMVFGLLFVAYSPTVGNLNIRNRLLSSRPLSTYILRYDNIDDRANIIDEQSRAGSVVSLNRSFDNPMYEEAASTRSTSNETVILPKLEEEKGIKSNEETKNEMLVVLDSAKELEDIDLRSEIVSEKDDEFFKDL